MIITSTDNPKVAQVVKLADKKHRKVSGLYVIEGARLVADAIRHGAKVQNVFVSQSNADIHNFDGAIVVADKVFAKMCDTVTNQGVLAVVQMANEPITAPTGNCLVLDCLQDPGNVGTLIRTAVACGFTDIYAVNSVDVYSPKVLRSAMSAHFCINLHQCGSIQQVFDLMQGVTTVCADMDGQNVFCTRFDGKIALVLGNEGNGLSDFSRNNVSKTVALPMQNNFESLNVAVAGSVIMYQIFAQTIK